MKKYIFILGRDIELSLAELFSYLKKNQINYNVLDKFRDLIVIEIEKLFQIDLLGGLVKIAEVIEDKEYFFNNLTFSKNKIKYVVNDEEIRNNLKKIFKEQGIKAFYKSEIKSLTTASRVDLELIKFKDHLAKVIMISNPKEYKKRDELRPFFDAKKVTSIRLAKILINLSEARNEILDPFCGSGTILQEALLLNLNACGLDLNIKEAKENLGWLRKNFNFKPRYRVFQGDSRSLSNYFNRVECVVTEPYLGPYFKKYPRYDEALMVIKDLERLYIDVFKELNKVVEKSVVILLPIIKTNVKKNLKINIIKLLEGTNFKIRSENFPIIYFNKGAIVEREIYVLDKVRNRV